MKSQIELQIGKKGLTNELLNTLKERFDNKKIKNIRIKVLQSARRNGRKDVKQYSEEILNFLGKKFNTHIIGFTIVVLKYKKERFF
ncbi:MAG: hypothetical protein QXW97_04555 [Candidatus Pacearchaeota archaeon]